MPLSIPPAVRIRLENTVRAVSAEVRAVKRAKIILAAAAMAEASWEEIAKAAGCGVSTVRKWVERFRASPCIQTLSDAGRSGRPHSIPAAVKCQVAAVACSPKPEESADFQNTWTLESIKAETLELTGVSVSKSEIHRILNNTDIRPHKEQMWLHSCDPDFREKCEAICKLYLAPPEGAHVICVDEKTGMQALERKNPSQPAGPSGKLPRTEYEYKRHGTQSLIASFDVLTGAVWAHCGPTRKGDDLENFMDSLADMYPEGEVYVVWDNLNIHCGERWNKFNESHGMRFHFVHTPLHASWVNQIEIWFGILQRRVINRSSFRSTEQLATRVMDFVNHWNSNERHPFKWAFRGVFKEAA